MSSHRVDQASTAAAVVHAITVHAQTAGLLPEGVRLHEAHPALAGFGDRRYNPGIGSAPAMLPFDPAERAGNASDTYYLADLYQQLSVEAVKQRAFCQTPQFVTSLMLTCTWENAVNELHREPYAGQPLPLRAIDPACGGGHILVELLRAAFVASALREREAQVRDALAVVHGVDLDPFAACIARYRLLEIACRWLRCRLDEAPGDLPIQVAAGNSLLYRESVAAPEGMLFAVAEGDVVDLTPVGGPYADVHLFPGILDEGRYDVVVANPPYVTPKDPTMRDAVRSAYPDVCHGQYSLAVPFEPLFHRLCRPGGWVARLTANSFMKREFGRPLIEKYFPTIDMQWIIDTSGAYIPGHGTPTVILVSRNRAPTGDTVRTVLGCRGEPSVPKRPSDGLVWRSIESAVYPYEQGRRAAADMWHVDQEIAAAEEAERSAVAS